MEEIAKELHSIAICLLCIILNLSLIATLIFIKGR